MRKQYQIQLSADERAALTTMTRVGTERAYRIRRANMLLLAARGQTDAQIGADLRVHPRTVGRLRQRATQDGVLAALDDRPRPGAPAKLDSTAEAVLVATACADPPAGHARWSTYLLADRLVALEVVDTISAQTVWRTLKKTSFSRG
jgi:transposase